MDFNKLPTGTAIESPKAQSLDSHKDILEKGSDRELIESKICQHLQLDQLDKMFETINDTDLKKCLGFLENFDPKTQSDRDLYMFVSFLQKVIILKEDSKLCDKYLGDLIKYLASVEPNPETCQLYLNAVCVYGNPDVAKNFKEFLEQGDREMLSNLFSSYLINEAADVAISGIKAMQPTGFLAHMLHASKFAVEFAMKANDALGSPVAGTVMEVKDCPYDFNYKVVAYINSCKAQNQELDEAEILKLISANGFTDNTKIRKVAQKTLRVAEDFMKITEANFTEYLNTHRESIPRSSSIKIKDDRGNIHIIRHLQAKVSVGDKVKQGQEIAEFGYSSGFGPGNGAHYEASDKNGKNLPLRNRATATKATQLYANLPGFSKYLDFLGNSES